jgi:hypothetical protein
VTIERSEFIEDEGRETKTSGRTVYVTFVEVRPRAGCRILSTDEFSGALTMCFLPANSPDDALGRLQNCLDAERLDIVSVDYCLDAATMQELDEDDDELVRIAGTENRVLFGNIVAWDDRGPSCD